MFFFLLNIRRTSQRKQIGLMDLYTFFVGINLWFMARVRALKCSRYEDGLFDISQGDHFKVSACACARFQSTIWYWSFSQPICQDAWLPVDRKSNVRVIVSSRGSSNTIAHTTKSFFVSTTSRSDGGHQHCSMWVQVCAETPESSEPNKVVWPQMRTRGIYMKVFPNICDHVWDPQLGQNDGSGQRKSSVK